MIVCAAAEAEAICSISGILWPLRTFAATTTITGARNALSRSRCNSASETVGSRRRSESAINAPNAARCSSPMTTKCHGRSRP